jgi:hypothetical protein
LVGAGVSIAVGLLDANPATPDWTAITAAISAGLGAFGLTFMADDKPTADLK